MANSYQMLAARVIGVEQVTPLIKRFTLVRQDGQPLPDFTGGSHIIVQMKDADQAINSTLELDVHGINSAA